MAPKVQFTKEEIIDAAFNIALEIGLDRITVRKVSNQLGCSVAPIYVNFKNSEALVDSVIIKILALVQSYITKPYTSIGFLNIGIGQILFVKAYPKLYHDMEISSQKHKVSAQDNASQMLNIMMNDQLLEGFTREQCTELLFQMSVYTHGISASIANGHISPDTTVMELAESLKVTGMELIYAKRANIKHPDISINLEL